jgi:hypothetical protein
VDCCLLARLDPESSLDIPRFDRNPPNVDCLFHFLARLDPETSPVVPRFETNLPKVHRIVCGFCIAFPARLDRLDSHAEKIKEPSLFLYSPHPLQSVQSCWESDTKAHTLFCGLLGGLYQIVARLESFQGPVVPGSDTNSHISGLPIKSWHVWNAFRVQSCQEVIQTVHI